MNLFTVLVAAIARKVKAVAAEYNKMLAEAKVAEKEIVTRVKSEAKAIVLTAETEEARLLREARLVIQTAEHKASALKNEAEAEVKVLYDDLINKVAKL